MSNVNAGSTRPSAEQPEHTQQAGQRAADRRYLAAAAGLPVVALGIALVVVATLWASLPTVVASHWGPAGVDATQGRTGYVVSGTLLVAGLAALLAVAGWFTPSDGRRMVAGVSGAVSGFLVVVLFGALVGQRGLTDPAQATFSGLLLLAGAAVAVVLGWAAWAIAAVRVSGPTSPADRAPLPKGAVTVPVSDGERLAWFGHAAGAPWLGWVCVALAALACFCAVVASPLAAFGPALGIALVVLLARARVTVDTSGLRVVSMGFLTWLTVPLESVSYAEVSSLTAFKEFGGFGMRYRKDARAFVTRSGEALLVVQQDGTRTYVSMDDSASAAAVLNTLSQRTVRS